MSQRPWIDEMFTRQQLLLADSREAGGRGERLRALRAWQAARLAHTYADVRGDAHYARAIEFFLSDLYAPQESLQRDRELRRAWRYMSRALPAAMLDILGRALELQLLTAELDAAMAGTLAPGPVSHASYAAAFCTVGKRLQRCRQIDLITGIGQDLRRLVRRVWVGPLLRAAHAPAHAAGFGVLQDFLERGYAAFAGMPDPDRLLQLIRERETDYLNALYLGRAGSRATGGT